MNNELIVKKSWWNRNWKWFLPTIILVFLIGFGLILTSAIDGNMTDIAQAYSENSLYENAIEKAKTNKRVIEVIGEIEPIDKLAIFEGNVIYSNNNKSVVLSVRVKGNKGKGKMDISADKNGTLWEYKKINIRIKDPKEEIQILEDSIGEK
jgi:Cytochrome oxidase complex assembly protein 1